MGLMMFLPFYSLSHAFTLTNLTLTLEYAICWWSPLGRGNAPRVIDNSRKAQRAKVVLEIQVMTYALQEESLICIGENLFHFLSRFEDRSRSEQPMGNVAVLSAI